MKKLFAMFAIVAAAAFGATSVSAQCCPSPILTACAGECDGNISERSANTSSVTVTESGCFKACVTNSLCGSTGVRAFIRSGNRVLAVINSNNNPESREFCVQAGETITVEIVEGRVNPDIQCIRQGEAIVNVCPVVTQ